MRDIVFSFRMKILEQLINLGR